ncbi:MULTISPECIES: heavy metal translocating P-type ATPase [Flavobacterium]|uniref:HAD family hydrolase n=2 Tax=Flavobacterium TaxID=237 RepID=A0AA94JP62_9FLAO|nr:MULTISPECIES: heavy metal translocating P-type ATPase metal-binding domain-containing protein [Flavobacterium]OXA78981.1 ATPase [Flavobacterium columnare] [Flavobacterium columnare NBRC 100251 = ATCC 23463]AMA49194.1 ATPase [Flavobacterium covae]AND64738.1 ATPase [Flavobacterium covae]MCH4831124.1 heavy metal translocating P-type ATPase metal-binding domain-containing protein [Flavobacterium columnare]MCH4832935.1 heavy metal translocating P-type ATPase metal-binding domain-containing prote
MDKMSCFHCGNDIVEREKIDFEDRSFCCVGCKTVYEIFSQNDLICYYDFEKSPGATPQDVKGKYNFLNDDKIVSKLLDFEEERTHIISLYIPHIHCSSCIWILENLQKLMRGIVSSQVNFHQKKVRITYSPEIINLKEIVEILSKIGYEPYISLENYENKKQEVDRTLIYKIGIAFFSFGNIMLLSFPEYFEVGEFWIEQYKGFFRWLIFALSLPPFFYSASSYYMSAWKSIRSKMLNIDIPIALGIIVMFVRSTIDIVFDYGQGFFDSMCGLIFFMLLGRLFQQKTYNFLSFERDYKSYFPIAITKINTNGNEEPIQVYDITKGDRLLIRNQELIPVDGILISSEASIDYSFVTGEAIPMKKKSGDKVYAGGKQIGKIIEIEVLHSVSQSYLTQLWSNDVFQKRVEQKYKTITDTISKYFTPALLLLAFVSFAFWIFQELSTAFNVFTAILIVACPCALALTAPFTLGNVLRIMGYRKFYLKNATVIEQLAKVDTIVFDKTGTITTNKKTSITYEGSEFNDDELKLLKNVLRTSNHPLSRRLYDFIPTQEKIEITYFEEIIGKGIFAELNGRSVKLGSSQFLEHMSENTHKKTKVHVAIDGVYKGNYVFNNQYREGLEQLFENLSKRYKLVVLSGDNDGERKILEKMLPSSTCLVFNQKPEEKLQYIEKLQKRGDNVMMVGDGLNDAGALAQSNIGIAISENVNVFSPACDGILDATQFSKIDFFMKYSKNAMKTIYMSFVLSLLYNVVGLSYAVTGNLLPIVAAIIMPLSTITIVSFVTLMSNFYASKKGL